MFLWGELPAVLQSQILLYLGPGERLRSAELSLSVKELTDDPALWTPMSCVHCGKEYIHTDNRSEKCVGAINKNGRRHKSTAKASRSELRQKEKLIANRTMVGEIRAGRLKPNVQSDRWEDCIACQKRYLGYAVPDAQWAELPAGLQSHTLCLECFLSKTKSPRQMLPKALGVAVAAVVVALYVQWYGLDWGFVGFLFGLVTLVLPESWLQT
jgi:hypothetical protein